jgi:hypothetical protein
MKKNLSVLVLDNDFLVDLTFHGVSASLIAEFAETIVKPYYHGNLNVESSYPSFAVVPALNAARQNPLFEIAQKNQ